MNSEENKDQVNEPSAEYSAKKIILFNSIDEQSEHHLRKMAFQSHEENMSNLEILRKIFLKEFLQPDGSWKPMVKILRFREPFK